MKLTSLQLKNFRSYTQKSLNFGKPVTIFIGPNAIGKTNIIEAIVMLALGKSFRAQKDEEMIQFNEDFSRIGGEVDEESLEIVLTHGFFQGKKVAKKRFLVNGVGKRRKEFLRYLQVVLFQPEDIDLIIDSPGKKRNYLDFVLSQIDFEYDRSLNAYTKGLRQRNRLLHLISEGKAQINQLEFWNRLLIKNGEIIRIKRQEYLDYLNLNCRLDNFIQTKDQKYKSSLPIYYYKYLPSAITPSRLMDHLQAEIASKNTLIGPHRDKFEIYQYFKEKNDDKKDISLYASRGEQRIAVLTLKLTELEFVSEKIKDRPVLLLDDIFSELDEAYQNIILDVIKKQQTIITTTDIDHVNINDNNLFEVINLVS